MQELRREAIATTRLSIESLEISIIPIQPKAPPTTLQTCIAFILQTFDCINTPMTNQIAGMSICMIAFS